MATLVKRGRYYYGRWQKSIGEKRLDVRKSLGFAYKDNAQKALSKLERLEEAGEINPYDSGFDPKKVLNDLNQQNKAAPIYTIRKAADCFYQLKASSLSKKTVRNDPQKRSSKRGAYERAIEHFITFNEIADLSPRQVRLKHFEAIIFKPGIKPPTRWFYFRQLKTFWSTLLERNIVIHNFFLVIKKSMSSKKKGGSKWAKMLTEEELKVLFKAFDKEVARKKQLPEWMPHYGQRWFKPLICCYFFGGFRKHEAAYTSDLAYSGLKGQNLIYKDDILDCIYLDKTKGRAERLVAVSVELREALEYYMAIRGRPVYDQYLFIYLGGSKKGWPVSGQRVYKEFKRYLKLAGLPKSRTLHGMRHSRITDWLENGCNTSQAQVMAGHTKSSTTNDYTHLARKGLVEMQQEIDKNKKQLITFKK